MSGYGYGWGWAPYVSVAQRRKNAEKAVAKLVKKGQKITPVKLDGKILAKTFWGKGWCDHLESFSDYESRLPRGRTYVRNGSVVHLQIESGKISALVMGNSLYKTNITVKFLENKKWKEILKRCSGKIESILELLQGSFSSGVMQIVANPKTGLFPLPKEISFDCTCLDWADMCKHVTAVLYGVGNRLDKDPKLLFLLRKVDPIELVNKVSLKIPRSNSGKSKRLKNKNLSEVFGIEVTEKL